MKFLLCFFFNEHVQKGIKVLHYCTLYYYSILFIMLKCNTWPSMNCLPFFVSKFDYVKFIHFLCMYYVDDLPLLSKDLWWGLGWQLSSISADIGYHFCLWGTLKSFPIFHRIALLVILVQHPELNKIRANENNRNKHKPKYMYELVFIKGMILNSDNDII